MEKANSSQVDFALERSIYCIDYRRRFIGKCAQWNIILQI